MDEWLKVSIPAIIISVVGFGTYLLGEVRELKVLRGEGKMYVQQIVQLRKEANDFEHRLRVLEGH